MRHQGHGKDLSTDLGLCQWCFLAAGPLDRLGLHLVLRGEEPATIQVALRPVASLWDYERGGTDPLWRGGVELAPGCDEMVWCHPACQVPEAGAYRIEVDGPGHVAWRLSGDHGWGLAAGTLIGSGRYKWRKYAELAFRLDPAQAVYGPEQVLSGVTLPQRQTNAWFSDPGQALPQHLDLRWDTAVSVARVELTFPGQVVFEPRFEDPFYIAPTLARRYRLQIRDPGGSWRDLCREDDNQLVRRSHRLPKAVSTDHLRLLIEATHGADSAGLVEIRCYAS